MKDLTWVKVVMETTSCEEALEKINNEGWSLITAYTRYNKKTNKIEIAFSLGHKDIEKNPYS